MLRRLFWVCTRVTAPSRRMNLAPVRVERAHVKWRRDLTAPANKLPPRGPYVSGSGAHRALIALRPVKAAIDRAIEALSVLDTER